jgi:hypothetical protein
MPSHYGNDARRSNIAALIGNFTRSAGNVANRASSAHQAGLDRRQQQKQHEDAIKEAKKGRRASILQNLLSTGTQIATPFIQNKITEHSMREGGPLWNFQKQRSDWELEANKELEKFRSKLENKANLPGGANYEFHTQLLKIENKYAMALEEQRHANDLALRAANPSSPPETTYEKYAGQLKFYRELADLGDPRVLEAFFPSGAVDDEAPFAPGLTVWAQLGEYERSLGAASEKTNAQKREEFLSYLGTVIDGNTELSSDEVRGIYAVAPQILDLYFGAPGEDPSVVTTRRTTLETITSNLRLLLSRIPGWRRRLISTVGDMQQESPSTSDPSTSDPSRQVGTGGGVGLYLADERPVWADKPEEASFHRIYQLLPNKEATMGASSDGSPWTVTHQYNWMKNNQLGDDKLKTLLAWIKRIAKEQGVTY